MNHLILTLKDNDIEVVPALRIKEIVRTKRSYPRCVVKFSHDIAVHLRSSPVMHAFGYMGVIG